MNEERLEIMSLVQSECQKIINSFINTELGPINSAFCLGVAGNMIVDIVLQKSDVSDKRKDEYRQEILASMVKGFTETESQVIFIKK